MQFNLVLLYKQLLLSSVLNTGKRTTCKLHTKLHLQSGHDDIDGIVSCFFTVVCANT